MVVVNFVHIFSPQGLDRTKTIFSSGDWWGGAIGPVNSVTCLSAGPFLICKHCVHPAGLPLEICYKLFHQGGCPREGLGARLVFKSI